MRPVIGITTYSSSSVLGGEETGTAMLPSLYITAVRRAGGCPVLLPAGGDYDEGADALTSVDGLILPGGPDIDPRAYRQPRHYKTQPPDLVRDEWEYILTSQALALNIPLLGICRGMQVINVALGGTLHQHIRAFTRHMPAGTGFSKHNVTIEPGSKLATIMDGTPLASVTTRHHQCVDLLGRDLRPVAWETDGTVEAVEHATPQRFVLGLQWHPERDDDQRVFGALVAAAEEQARVNA